MAPKRSTKQSAGLSQPTLSFQTRLRTAGAKAAAKQKGVTSATTAPATRKSAAAEVSSGDSVTPPAEADDVSAKKEEVAEAPKPKVQELPKLDPNGKEWNGLYKEAKAEMGGMPPIHGEKDSKVDNILRVFDMTSKYGPCAGMTRLQRWERAKKWGLNPPEEIKEILLTQQGEKEPVYRESVLYGWV